MKSNNFVHIKIHIETLITLNFDEIAKNKKAVKPKSVES